MIEAAVVFPHTGEAVLIVSGASLSLSVMLLDALGPQILER